MNNNFKSLMNDIVFNHLFSNKKIVVDFLESFFDKKIGKDVIIKTECVLDKTKYQDKGMICDVIVETEDTIYDIEAYTNFNKSNIKKSESYCMRIFGTQLERSENYLGKDKKTKKVVQLNLCKRCEIKEDEVNKYGILNYRDNTTKMFGEDLLIYVVVLDKIKEKNYNVGTSNKMIKYYKMFNAESLEEVKMIAKGDDVLMTISKELDEFLNDEKTKRLFDRDLWLKREYHYEGEKAGMKAGKKAGIKSNQIKTAKKMLLEKFQPEMICKITELPLDEIRNLQKNLKKA